MTDFYEYKAKSISGDDVSMENYKDKVVLVVNTASKCGLTPQFEGLQKLHEEFKDEGFFTQDSTPNFYLYKMITREHTFIGIVGATSVEDYENNVIKIHENTLEKRELLFKDVIVTDNCNIIFSVYFSRMSIIMHNKVFFLLSVLQKPCHDLVIDLIYASIKSIRFLCRF